MAEASTAVALAEPERRRAQQIRVVADPIPVLDTARFEHMQRIATVMAHSNLIPDTLCFEKNDAGNKVALPLEMVTANCFLVVNQAVRWNMDPFAVAQCVSVVHGKLCYEGKLIAAVLEGKLGVELEYEISGTGEAMQVIVTGTYNGKPVLDSKGQPKIVKGTVGEWKTDGKGSPWGARGGYPRMLRYRGAREWGRIHSPGLMLGVYGDDEMEDLNTRFAARVDDGGGPPSPAANDDGGGPPVPNHAAITSEVVDDGGGPPAPAAEQTEDFPGDKPMAGDNFDDGIPDYLRRSTDKPPISDDEQKWLNGLEAAFGDCRDAATLFEQNAELMLPEESSVSVSAWNEACQILDRHIERLQE
jgi:hypothetical protein